MSDQSAQPPERPSEWERPGSGSPPPPPPPPPSPPYQQPPPGYAPQYGYPGYTSPGTNGFAIASLVLGILWIAWIGSILALVFGYVAKSQIRRTGQSGDGMATAGIVLGWIGVGFLLLSIVVNVIEAVAS
jgi:uncharacterized protein DUF4190